MCTTYPPRELPNPTFGKEKHLQKCLASGYVSSQEGHLFIFFVSTSEHPFQTYIDFSTFLAARFNKNDSAWHDIRIFVVFSLTTVGKIVSMADG